jgi:hypothetical protein
MNNFPHFVYEQRKLIMNRTSIQIQAYNFLLFITKLEIKHTMTQIKYESNPKDRSLNNQ